MPIEFRTLCRSCLHHRLWELTEAWQSYDRWTLDTCQDCDLLTPCTRAGHVVA